MFFFYTAGNPLQIQIDCDRQSEWKGSHFEVTYIVKQNNLLNGSQFLGQNFCTRIWKLAL